MNLESIINRQRVPQPWSEGEKIPWNDENFSRRMLAEHLDQTHDAASRRFSFIDRQIDWIQEQVLAGKTSHILDLGCGPGLYSNRLARLGHTCIGIDFSPASIEYARQQALREGLACTYRLEDLRQADFGMDFDLALLIFGELNVFRPLEARAILEKTCQALVPGEQALLEVHTFETVRELGCQPPDWTSRQHGLFSDKPYLCLHESIWDRSQATATERYYIIDTESGEVTRHASTTQAYTEEEYRSLLKDCGFAEPVFLPHIGVPQPGLFAILARKE